MGPSRPRYESQPSPTDKGSDYETDDSDRYVIEWNGKRYQVFEAWTGTDRDHTLPAGAQVIAYNTDPDRCHALIDTDGDGKPNMLTWNPSPEQFKAWADAGQVSPNLIPNNLGKDFSGDNPDGVESAYGTGAKTAPDVTGEEEGGTFGDKKVVYDHVAMTVFRDEVTKAVEEFERGSGGVAALATIAVEPGQTPQAQKLRELFNLPAGRATDWFDTHVFELPQNLKAMTDAVDAASTKVKGSDTEMEISAKALADAMDAGAGAGSSTDISYDDI
jgi:hypothetical protein